MIDGKNPCDMTSEEAIEIIKVARAEVEWECPIEYAAAFDKAIEALEREPLTDTEQRIFLAAMGKEEMVCKEVDEKYSDREPYEDSLASVCRSIERKVKRALWS
jgi:hypothetical protein